MHADANIIFGATIDDALGDEVRVTVIAAGFEGGRPKRRDEGHGLRPRPAQTQKPQTQEETRAAARALAEQRKAAEHGRAASGAGHRRCPASGRRARSRRRSAARPRRRFGDDELDVPDFLK